MRWENTDLHDIAVYLDLPVAAFVLLSVTLYLLPASLYKLVITMVSDP